MLSCPSFGSHCVDKVNTLFTNASTFVSMNSLSLQFSLYWPIPQGCPLAPYLYVLTIDALGDLLEVAHIAGLFRGIMLLDDS
jgi:hypothetical protein